MKIDRREFIRASALSMAAIGLGAAAPPTIESRNGMPYRVLGKTGEKVSLLCLGGYHVAVRQLTEAESIGMMRTAIDEGVNFFDNSISYNSGRSEELMGKALKDGYRDKVFLMTKFDGLSYAEAKAHLEESLRRFDLDYVDLWQFHECIRPEQVERVHAEGVLQLLEDVRKEGKVRYVGFTGHYKPEVMAEMFARGYDWETIQMPLNCFDPHFRSFEKSLLPMALERNMGVIAMKTLGQGAIPNKSGAVTAAECLRYAMNLPVSTVCSGMDSMDKLKENIAVAKAFKPMEPQETLELLAKTRPHALDGNFEAYKTQWHQG